jgi:hypothetical protein
VVEAPELGRVVEELAAAEELGLAEVALVLVRVVEAALELEAGLTVEGRELEADQVGAEVRAAEQVLRLENG